jgi:hypothetical protein
MTEHELLIEALIDGIISVSTYLYYNAEYRKQLLEILINN